MFDLYGLVSRHNTRATNREYPVFQRQVNNLLQTYSGLANFHRKIVLLKPNHIHKNNIMTEETTEELGPSNLGTLDFWENVYTLELDNFKGHGDVGEIWFGKKASLNVVKWISSKLNLDKNNDVIVDIGCGNGMMLVELAKQGFKQLVGVDYSQKAIELANEVLKENKVDSKLQVCDILDSEHHGLPMNYFKVAHDKGTYDAISLHPENPAIKRGNYIKNVYDILETEGYLILTSCNWTKEELLLHFKNNYDFIDELPMDSFQFGGKKGNTVTQLVFKKKCK